jgi:hypothetical protein
MSQNSNNQATNDRRNSVGLDGSTRIYPPNLLKNENNTVPLSSTPTNEKFSTAIDEQHFPQLPSPPAQGDNE